MVAEAGAANAKPAANWLMGDVSSLLNREGVALEAAPVEAGAAGQAAGAYRADGTVSNNTAVPEGCLPGHVDGEEGGDADAIIAAKGLKQMSDSGEVGKDHR
ncbi:hypothetical protein ACU4GD_09150 [Cupriavidus basilensis]